MKEEVSEIKLNETEGSHLKMFKNITKQFLFDPIQELEIKVDNSSPDDEDELKKIIGEYLCYPSSELAEIHSEAMKIGNYDL